MTHPVSDLDPVKLSSILQKAGAVVGKFSSCVDFIDIEYTQVI